MEIIKKAAIVWIVGVLLAVPACSKTVMQKPAPADPEPTVGMEPAPVQPETPAPVLQADDASETERSRFLYDHVYFEFDSASLTPDTRRQLDFKAQWLRDNPEVVAVLIAGHCDERGSEAYNLILGDRRAIAVKHYLLDQGIAGDKLETRSFGETAPLDERSTEEAWAKNRRVSFVIN
jgi:peptidoglycan-associated lipoprotein